MPKILTFTDYYLPGYKGGGLIRALANLVEQIGDDYSFYIVTRDRDMNSSDSYSDVAKGTWQSVGKAHVQYLAPGEITITKLRQIVRGSGADLIYLNGIFPLLCIWVLLLRKLRQTPDIPVLIAPRGSLLPGNLKLEAHKKTPFMFLVRLIGLYSNVTWQALSENEADSIRASFGRDIETSRSSIMIASDLLLLAPDRDGPPLVKKAGAARFIFLSRISPEKNIDFVLELLANVTAEVWYDIYGEIDNERYWGYCQQIIKRLPPNIHVSYKGSIPPSEVHSTFARYHLFIFPSQGDAFGFAPWEALSAGCPVLISDRTPLRDFEQNNCGWVVPLEEPSEFQARIQEMIVMDQPTFSGKSTDARNYARKLVETSNQVDASRQMFDRASNHV